MSSILISGTEKQGDNADKNDDIIGAGTDVTDGPQTPSSCKASTGAIASGAKAGEVGSGTLASKLGLGRGKKRHIAGRDRKAAKLAKMDEARQHKRSANEKLIADSLCKKAEAATLLVVLLEESNDCSRSGVRVPSKRLMMRPSGWNLLGWRERRSS